MAFLKEIYMLQAPANTPAELEIRKQEPIDRSFSH
jgi:hypothetical protein